MVRRAAGARVDARQITPPEQDAAERRPCAARTGFARHQYLAASLSDHVGCGGSRDGFEFDDGGRAMAESKKDIVVRKGDIEKAPTPFARRFDEMERVFDDFFGRSWLRPFGAWGRPIAAEFPLALPKVDVVDRDDEVVVRAEVPGMEKDELEVSVAGNMLTLKGETRREEKEEKGEYYRCEMSHGAFSRTLALPAEVDDTKVKATLKDGVLELKLAKVEKSKRRTIKID
jgi:HSP20 family protein